jgi:hypothetical protein
MRLNATMSGDAYTIPLSAQDVMHDITLTVHVTGARALAWRFTFARWLFRVAAWVLGCAIVIDFQPLLDPNKVMPCD